MRTYPYNTIDAFIHNHQYSEDRNSTHFYNGFWSKAEKVIFKRSTVGFASGSLCDLLHTGV